MDIRFVLLAHLNTGSIPVCEVIMTRSNNLYNNVSGFSVNEAILNVQHNLKMENSQEVLSIDRILWFFLAIFFSENSSFKVNMSIILR